MPRLTNLIDVLFPVTGTLTECPIPRADITRLLSAVMLIKRPAPMGPESPEANEWAELDRHLQELTDRYFNELGGNAYAAFNAITDFASHPPANRLLRRDRHSLQRLAGHWLADFTKQCRIPDFNFSSYVENFNATLNTRVSLS